MTSPFRDVKPPGPRPDRGVPPAVRRTVRLVAGLVVLGVGLLGVRALMGGVGAEGPAATAGAAGGLPPADTAADAGDASGTGPPSGPSPSDGPPELVMEDTLRPGESLGRLLRGHGLLEPRELDAVVDAVRRHEEPRRLQPGLVVRFAARVPERLSRITLRLDRDRSLEVRPEGPGWSARLDSVPVTMDTVFVGGVVDGSLWGARLFGDTARLKPNEDREIVLALANDLYPWQIDFFLDLRPGDAFRVMIEREIRPDGSMRRARILAAEFFNDDRWLPAVRFDPPRGPAEYYDDEGEAVHKAFLRMPMEYGRRTSGFTRRRYHPVLKRYRAHRGIDYGAPRGTPVLATGGGVVTRAGRWGGYGRMIEIRHSGKYRTRYAHLSAIADGVRRGARVEQKDVIGYVGSTGLSTAPHLHYEFLVNGAQRPPSRVDLPPGEPLEERHVEAFRREVEARLSLMAREAEFPSGDRRRPAPAVSIED